ncbi:hypothetical protein PVAP13_2KG022832 [Panicum virgatum]|uniref:Uncharacterized protein n=1 Tax=Panicum virgatum TaxID=38727 RepID=A0A8T0W8J3_PANVG|nr:hypothetical protein PVAP13_2KG022832 [Panicum virgatum]
MGRLGEKWIFGPHVLWAPWSRYRTVEAAQYRGSCFLLQLLASLAPAPAPPPPPPAFAAPRNLWSVSRWLRSNSNQRNALAADDDVKNILAPATARESVGIHRRRTASSIRIHTAN